MEASESARCARPTPDRVAGAPSARCLPHISGLCSLLQSEPEGFSHFHLYVCAAFLVRWRKEILEERDFQVSECLFKDPRWGFLLSSQGYLWESRAAAWKLVKPGQVQPWPCGAVPLGCVLLPRESSRGPVFSADAGGAADRQLGADAVGRVPRLPWSQKLLSSPSSGQPHAAHA